MAASLARTLTSRNVKPGSPFFGCGVAYEDDRFTGLRILHDRAARNDDARRLADDDRRRDRIAGTASEGVPATTTVASCVAGSTAGTTAVTRPRVVFSRVSETVSVAGSPTAMRRATSAGTLSVTLCPSGGPDLDDGLRGVDRFARVFEDREHDAVARRGQQAVRVRDACGIEPRLRGRCLAAEHALLRARRLHVVAGARDVRLRRLHRRVEIGSGRRDLRVGGALIGEIAVERGASRRRRLSARARRRRRSVVSRASVARSACDLERRLARDRLRRDARTERRRSAALQRLEARDRERQFRQCARHVGARYRTAAVARGRGARVRLRLRRPHSRAPPDRVRRAAWPALTLSPTRTSTLRTMPACANATFALLPAGGPMRPCACDAFDESAGARRRERHARCRAGRARIAPPRLAARGASRTSPPSATATTTTATTATIHAVSRHVPTSMSSVARAFSKS